MVKVKLKEDWNYALSQFPNVNIEESHKVFDEIFSIYSHDNRVYHGIIHIHSFIQRIKELLVLYTFDNIEKTTSELFLAAFMHDLYYNPKRHNTEIPIDSKSDEEISADMGIEFLKRINLNEPDSIKRVYELVRLTEKHEVEGDNICPNRMQKVFFDSDMGIIGDSPEKYDEYAKNIWEEYQHISPEVFIKGRIEFLTKLLENKAIFHTEYMNQLYGEQALKNIQREIQMLDIMTAEELIKQIQG